MEFKLTTLSQLIALLNKRHRTMFGPKDFNAGMPTVTPEGYARVELVPVSDRVNNGTTIVATYPRIELAYDEVTVVARDFSDEAIFAALTKVRFKAVPCPGSMVLEEVVSESESERQVVVAINDYMYNGTLLVRVTMEA